MGTSITVGEGSFTFGTLCICLFFILRNIYFFRWHTYSCIKYFNDILLEWEGRKASKKVDILSFTYYLLIILFQIIDENSIESQYNTHGS